MWKLVARQRRYIMKRYMTGGGNNSRVDGSGATIDGRGTNLVGHRVGNFIIHELIGTGAMGCVYRGVHETLDRQVAIKILRAGIASDEALVNRFIDEARAASKLGHPGLVEIYDFGVLEDGRRYSVMEFLNGQDLEGALRAEGPMGEGRVAAIGLQVASALSAAHAKGIVHRDLKPANVFLARNEFGGQVVKVLDFGIAKLLAGNSDARTKVGHIVGTPEYMAPEQAQARSSIDHRADIYSFGCMSYELLVGRPPHTGDNVATILVSQLQDTAVPPSQKGSKVSPDFEAIVMRCLAKKPEGRFQSMEELQNVLAPFADNSIVVPSSTRTSGMIPPPTMPPITIDSRPNRGGRSWMYMLAGLIVLGAAVVGGALIGGVGADKQNSDNAETQTGENTTSATTTVDTTNSVDSTPVGTDKNPYEISDRAVIAAGKVIWVAECSRCHGETGEGDGPEAKSGQEPKAFSEVTDETDYLDAYSFEVIRRGLAKAGMPAFGEELSNEDIWKVVTFSRTLSAKNENVDSGLDTRQPKTTDELIARGKVMYERKCKSCHGDDGLGHGPAAEFLKRKPVDLTLGVYKLRSTPKDSIPTDHDIFRTLTMGVGTGIMPGFPKVHPQDRWAMVAFIKTMSTRFTKEQPGQVFKVPKRKPPTKESIERGLSIFRMSGCDQCHGKDGLGDGVKGHGIHDASGYKIDMPNFTDRFDLLSSGGAEGLYQTMWNGLSGVKMPMGQTLMSEDDAWDVINWILSIQKKN